MARLACVPSELGSAAGFPKETIILQKPPPDEVRSFGGTLRTRQPSCFVAGALFNELN